MFNDLIQQIMLMQVQEAMPTIERFTVLLYHYTSNRLNTNECSRELFCQGRSISNIPQTTVALWKHILQSCYIVRHVWAQSMIKVQTLPTQKDWGWKFKNKKLRPHWTDFPEAAVAIRDLIKCDCNWKKVVEDNASMCNLSCFVQNFMFVRDNVNKNRHDLISHCLKYTFCSINYAFRSVNYVFWSVS